MRLFTLKIDPEECVGDSLGKHNFNLLSLDSTVCNLSSLFFSTFANDIPLESSFDDIFDNADLFNDNLTKMVNPIRFDIMYTGVKLLSSYYTKQELTVQYEFNRYKKDGKAEDCSLITNSKNPTFNSSLIQKSDNYITSSSIYNLSSYPVGSVINVIYPIFSNDGSIIERFRINTKTSQTEIDTTMQELSVLPIYSASVRSISGFFTKNDNYIYSVPTFRFVKNSNDWTYVATVSSLQGGPINYNSNSTIPPVPVTQETIVPIPTTIPTPIIPKIDTVPAATPAVTPPVLTTQPTTIAKTNVNVVETEQKNKTANNVKTNIEKTKNVDNNVKNKEKDKPKPENKYSVNNDTTKNYTGKVKQGNPGVSPKAEQKKKK